MKPLVYQYEDPAKQTVYFRGYVKTYQGATCTHVTCPLVRTSRLTALKDAKKLLITLRQQRATVVA